MNYTHLTQEERYQISILDKAGHSQKEIAYLLNRSESTVSRELSRNRGMRGYRPQQAQRKADERRAVNARTIDETTWKFVEEKLREAWSPEQISGHLEAVMQPGISHETIYQRVYADKQAGGHLWTYLRCQKVRKKRYGTPEHRGSIPNRRSIDERPSVVDTRSRVGDWEVDTIIGKHHKQALVSLTERKSGVALIHKVKRKTAEAVSTAIIQLLRPYKRKVHTLTSDNGKEFTDHESIAEALETDFYFAHAYSSWERGTNENTNGLIRQYFPKGSDFTAITQADIDHVMNQLNSRPRKRLGYQTPSQVFSKLTGIALQT